jgi:hypothetical protein
MTTVVSVVFFLHTVLCGSYALYLGFGLVGWSGRRLSGAAGHEFAVEDPKEPVVNVVGQVSLLLYLLYAEAYLYRSYRMLG